MVRIAVNGSARRFLPAERGTVRVGISLEHDDRESVVREVAVLHERLVADAKSHVHSGAATWWGSDQVWVRPERRYLKDSETYRYVQVASAEVRVKFQDFTALSDWVEQVGGLIGVSVHGIQWAATEEHRAQAEREVRVEAVRDAQDRAQAYASAIGGTEVTLDALWEPGLRPSGGGGDEGLYAAPPMYARVAADAAPMELRPDDLQVSASVTADFLVVLGA